MREKDFSHDSSLKARVGVIVLNFNGVADTLKCLESLMQADTTGIDCTLLVVDNGSSTRDDLKIAAAFPEVTVIRNESNLGWSGGNNTGLKYFRARKKDYLLLLNNDTIVRPSILVDLVGGFERNTNYGVIGPIINFMEDVTTVMTDGVAFNNSQTIGEFFERISIAEDTGNVPPVCPVDIVNGCCLMVSAEALEAVGLIDDRFFLIHEESDFCLRILRKGFNCGVLAKTLVFHKGSASFKRESQTWQRYYDVRNLCLLVLKHGGRISTGRSKVSSFAHCLAYSLYLYAKDSASSDRARVQIVPIAIYDFLTGRFGMFESSRKRPFLGLITASLATAVRIRGILRW
jgi:GT2 family glycosyltransferase